MHKQHLITLELRVKQKWENYFFPQPFYSSLLLSIVSNRADEH